MLALFSRRHPRKVRNIYLTASRWLPTHCGMPQFYTITHCLPTTLGSWELIRLSFQRNVLIPGKVSHGCYCPTMPPNFTILNWFIINASVRRSNMSSKAAQPTKLVLLFSFSRDWSSPWAWWQVGGSTSKLEATYYACCCMGDISIEILIVLRWILDSHLQMYFHSSRCLHWVSYCSKAFLHWYLCSHTNSKCRIYSLTRPYWFQWVSYMTFTCQFPTTKQLTNQCSLNT